MKKVVSIEGMHCEHCAAAVTNALEALEGVKSAKVVLKKNSATVKLTDYVSDEAIAKAVEDAGFKATEIK